MCIRPCLGVTVGVRPSGVSRKYVSEGRRWPIEDDKRIPSLGTTEPKEDRRLRREAQRGLTVGAPPDHWTEAAHRARACVRPGDPGAGPVWETEATWRRDQPRDEPTLNSGCGLAPTDPVVRAFSRDVHLHPPGEEEGRLTLYKGLYARVGLSPVTAIC